MLQQTQSTPLFTGRASFKAAAGAGSFPELRILRGRAEILAAQPMLAELAARTGQTGDVDSLGYFLSTPDAIKKTPHLILVGGRNLGENRPSAAVLLFEYRSPVAGTRVFSTADGSGRRDVIAPAGSRAGTAAFVARSLFERDAELVHIAYCERHAACDKERDLLTGETGEVGGMEISANVAARAIETELRRPTASGLQAEWNLREYEIPAYLPLLPTFDATLARIGAKTRFNLRYYRRRSQQELGTAFVAEPKISLDEFLAFNRECTYAVTDRLATFRYHTVQREPNQVIRGMRDAQGRWLSLVGTRRHNGFVELDWQMNRAGLPAASLATVMRAYLIEHEVSLGSTRLYIEGGTPQFIAGSFLRHRVGELTVTRNSRYVALLRRFGRHLFPPKNHIGQLLRDPALDWHRIRPVRK